jgi:putative restriction endonuclease
VQADPDAAIRAAAFAELEGLVLAYGSRLPWKLIDKGFRFRGEKVHFGGRATGIFKPRQMSAALSIRTVAPRAGRRIWYRDQVGEPDYRTGLLAYDLARGGKDDSTNRALDEAARLGAPLVYFVGVSPAVYEPLWPVWVEDLDFSLGRVLLAAADAFDPTMSSTQAAQASVAENNELRERSYSLVASKRRNHQAWFSSRTKSAYGHRCAFSGLTLSRLLVGAHILPDAEDGPATVTNGICMSTLHHTAFDAHLIGVDKDCRVHVARSVRDGRDGPLLKSLKGLDGTRLRLPRRPEDRPDREFLDWRFERFREVAG